MLRRRRMVRFGRYIEQRPKLASSSPRSRGARCITAACDIPEKILARFPPKWNRFGDKKARQIQVLEHVLIGKVHTLCRNML
jgi:hypothetical protein